MKLSLGYWLLLKIVFIAILVLFAARHGIFL